MVLKFLNGNQEYFDQMVKHAMNCLPEEACGLIFGRNNTISRIVFVENELHSPMHFRMDPQQQFDALVWGEENEMELIGIFHSHPEGPSHPSITDMIQFFYPGSLMVILSFIGNEWQWKAFEIEDEKYKEILIQICD